jgi:hypothetical protein
MSTRYHSEHPKKKPAVHKKADNEPQEALDSQPAGILDSLKASEIEEVLQASAEEAAKNYAADGKGNYDECVLVVNMALTLTGKAIGGKLGSGMVSASQEAAQKVCQRYFPSGQ